MRRCPPGHIHTHVRTYVPGKTYMHNMHRYNSIRPRYSHGIKQEIAKLQEGQTGTRKLTSVYTTYQLVFMYGFLAVC